MGRYKRKSATCVREDRISNLPTHLIDSILELLPFEEAVRTSIISKKWRYRWTTMKAMVFDKQFINKFSKNGAFDYDGLTSTMNQILSRNSDTNIVEILSNRHCEAPSNVFSCLELTKLELENCFYKPPLEFNGFLNLKDLSFSFVHFGANLCGTQINLPQLEKLTLFECTHVYNFNIKAPKLDHLLVITCPDAMLAQLLDNPFLIFVGLSLRIIDDFSQVERISLVNMLSNLPRIEELCIEGNVLKYLFAEKFPKWLPRAINSLKLLMLADIQFGYLDQLHGALCLLRNSPNLEKLRVIIFDMDPRVDIGPASNHLEALNCLDCTLKQLQTVEILQLHGSKPELLFIKLLLAHSPSLEKMSITPSGDLGVLKRFDIAKKVMRFPRTSTKAEMIYLNWDPYVINP